MDDEENKSDEVVKDIEVILRKNLLQYQYEVNPEKGQDDTHPKTQNIQSQEEKRKDDTPSILDMQEDGHVQVNVPEDTKNENAMDKGEGDVGKAYEVEDTQNPLVEAKIRRMQRKRSLR